MKDGTEKISLGKTRKVEFLVAYNDHFWDTKILDVPVGIKGNFLQEFGNEAINKIKSHVALVAVYCDPAPEI